MVAQHERLPTISLGTRGDACPSGVEVDEQADGYTPQSIISESATEPLLDADTAAKLHIHRARYYERLEAALEETYLTKRQRHHRDLWRLYPKKHKVPATWRGHGSLYHYELLVCRFKRVDRPLRPGRTVRVRRANWVRRLLRDQQREALAWFASLDPATRMDLAESHRFEDVARHAEERYIDRINREHRVELEMLRGNHG